MTKSVFRAVLLALFITLLAGCASPGGRLQTAGAATAFDMQFDTTLDWARIKSTRNEVWTIDGIPLNRLAIFHKVKPGEHVFQGLRERKSRPDGPWFRSGMRLDELQTLIVDGFVDQKWVNVTPSNLRPQTFGTVEGVRFDIDLTDESGLIYKGTVAAAERAGFLNVVFWIAPKEYYHGRDIDAVNRMLDGMRIQ